MSKTKDRIRESELRYKKSLGQNFIYDEDLLDQLAELSGVTPEEDVLEIGPGSGSLTRALARRAHSVTAVELDDRLIPLLEAFLHDFDNVRVIHGDAMTLNLAEATKDLRAPFRVAANIPYYITTPLVTMLLGSGLPIRSLALMVQREVADKMLARPGDEAWCPLSIRCQYAAEPQLGLEVPAACFTPPPKVDSAFVLLPMRDAPAVMVGDEALFFRVVNAAFALRRKTMLNNLCASFRLERAAAQGVLRTAGLDERVRGEKLTMEELARLTDALAPLLREEEKA